MPITYNGSKILEKNIKGYESNYKNQDYVKIWMADDDANIYFGGAFKKSDVNVASDEFKDICKKYTDMMNGSSWLDDSFGVRSKTWKYMSLSKKLFKIAKKEKIKFYSQYELNNQREMQ